MSIQPLNTNTQCVNICKFHYWHYDTVWPRAVSLLLSETEKLSLSSCFCCQHCSPTLKPQEECTWGLSLGFLGNESAEKGAARAGGRLMDFCHKMRSTAERWAEKRLEFSFNVGEFAEACDLIHSWSGWLWLPVGSGPEWMFYREQHTAALDIISHSSSETHPQLNTSPLLTSEVATQLCKVHCVCMCCFLLSKLSTAFRGMLQAHLSSCARVYFLTAWVGVLFCLQAFKYSLLSSQGFLSVSFCSVLTTYYQLHEYRTHGLPQPINHFFFKTSENRLKLRFLSLMQRKPAGRKRKRILKCNYDFVYRVASWCLQLMSKSCRSVNC